MINWAAQHAFKDLRLFSKENKYGERPVQNHSAQKLRAQQKILVASPRAYDHSCLHARADKGRLPAFRSQRLAGFHYYVQTQRE